MSRSFFLARWTLARARAVTGEESETLSAQPAGPPMSLHPVPTGITPIRGYRRWAVTADGRLLSPIRTTRSGQRTVWPVDGPTRAQCLPAPFAAALSPGRRRCLPKAVPAERCACGLYALRRDRAAELLAEVAALQPTPQRVDVVGEVDLSGTVVEGVGGYRAAVARVVALWRTWAPALDDRLFAVAERYAVPVVALPVDLPARGPAHGAADAAAPVAALRWLRARLRRPSPHPYGRT